MELLDPLDVRALHWINAYAQHYPRFDQFVSTIASLPLLKGVPLVAMLCWLWGEQTQETEYRRARLTAIGLASIAAFLLARILAHALPFRLRPMYRPELDWVLPVGMDPHAAQLWSAFPSDHGSMVGAIVAGICLFRRDFGCLAAICGSVVLLPRLYLGLHHPTDLIAGVFVGVAATLLMTRQFATRPIARGLSYWQCHHPASLNAVLFVAMYLLATNGDDVRQLLRLITHMW